MEDRRAHERIDGLEDTVKNHLNDHARFESTLTEIAENTKELVDLVRGAKGLRALVVWAAPVIAFVAAVYAWVKAH